MPNHKLSQEIIINRFKSIHGDTYNYSKFVYSHINIKSVIICRLHGEFLQCASAHLKGKGCPNCSKVKEKEFIERATQKYNNFYNYSLINYTGYKNTIKIICPKHGIFEQTPHKHLKNKIGCPGCVYEDLKTRELLTQKEFIEKAIQVHGLVYDYSKTKYIHSDVKITITCRKHGDFIQSSHQHLGGNGCPVCKTSHGERLIRNYLKENNIDFIPQKRFEGCVNKKKLPFDFFLPSYNIVIEYQGQQHYRPIKYWGGEKSFKVIKQNDSIKKNYCAENGIGYLSIPYTEDPIQKLQEVLLRYGQLLAHTKYSLIF